jgi:hypothetical protein
MHRARRSSVSRICTLHGWDKQLGSERECQNNDSATRRQSRTTQPAARNTDRPLDSNRQQPKCQPTAWRRPSPSDHLGARHSLAIPARTGRDHSDSCGVKQRPAYGRAPHSDSHRHLSPRAGSLGMRGSRGPDRLGAVIGPTATAETPFPRKAGKSGRDGDAPHEGRAGVGGWASAAGLRF